jgi:hypothetical protein
MKITHTLNQDIEIDLSYIDDAELFEELEERGLFVLESDIKAIIEDIYNAKANGQDTETLIAKLIDESLGRIL